jgi:hypothetical protein
MKNGKPIRTKIVFVVHKKSTGGGFLVVAQCLYSDKTKEATVVGSPKLTTRAKAAAFAASLAWAYNAGQKDSLPEDFFATDDEAIQTEGGK